MTRINNFKISIKYEKDGAAYEAVLGSDKLFFFEKAAKREEIRKLPEGEELIAALVNLAKTEGMGLWVQRTKDDKQNDGPNGEPAFLRTNAAGIITRLEYYKDGEHNNGPQGEPAVQLYSDDGQLQSTKRYTNGVLNNGPHGEPAVYGQAGQPWASIEYYNNGVRNDGPNGEPAKTAYDGNGLLRTVEYCKDGEPHNGPDGAPAGEHRLNGKLFSTVHYNDDGLSTVSSYLSGELYEVRRSSAKGAGFLGDGPHGEPAVQLYSEGKLVYIKHCRDGWCVDAPDGAPSIQVYDKAGQVIRAERFENRKRVSIEHFKDNKRNDGPNGEPALQRFNDSGKLVHVEHFKDGVSQGKLSWIKKKSFARKQKKLGL